MYKTIKVRLKTDLTNYLSGLITGTEGVTVGAKGMWSRGSDRFISVHFPGKGTLDVLWNSLEVIDEEYLNQREETEQRLLEEFRSAYDIIKCVGPRGGFKYLSYRYTDSDGIRHSVSTHFRDEADKLINTIEEYGINVVTKVLT